MTATTIKGERAASTGGVVKEVNVRVDPQPAAGNTVGGQLVQHRFQLAAGALADTDIVLEEATRVIDAIVILRGAGVASTVITIKNGANAISNGMAASGADTTVSRAGTIDDANWNIPAGGTLRATSSAGATQPACDVIVFGIKI